MITVLAVIFRHYLEAMKTWGGREIVDIDADALPRLRLIEPPYPGLFIRHAQCGPKTMN
jgi:hypothetical protein